MELLILAALGYYFALARPAPVVYRAPTTAYVPPPVTTPKALTLTQQYPFLSKYIGHDLSLDETHKLRDAIDKAFPATKWDYPTCVAIWSILSINIKLSSRWHFWIYAKDLKTGKLWRSAAMFHNMLWIVAADNGGMQQDYRWQVVMRWNPEGSGFVDVAINARKQGVEVLGATVGAFVKKVFGVDVGAWLKKVLKGKETQAMVQVSGAMSSLDSELGKLG